MMETKLWTGLCVLLLIHWGSADDKQQPASTEIALSGEGHQVPAASAIPASGHQPANHTVSAVKGSDTNTTSNGTSSLSSSTTTSFAPKVKKDNDTSIISPSVSVTTENATKTEEFASPPVLPTESQTSLSVTTTASTTTTTKSPSHTPHNASVDIPATSTSNYSQPPDSISPSMQPTQPKTDPSTSTTTITTAITTTQPSSTSTSSEAQTPTLQNKPTATVTPSSTSTEAKACSENPSPLNVGVNTKMVHDSPALDPLLAGLVSAFIITAVIITLLLFLKLRRRDNQPEFRRLQDLPMDDMMEDTPLSMYSY